jgi:hypothetical protein
MKSSFALVLSLAAFARAAQVVISATDGAVAYAPTPGDGSWAAIRAPGALNGGEGAFLLGQNDKGKIQISPSQAFTGFRFFGWQRSDGGIYQITFDGARAARIDVYNKDSNGDATPMELFKVDGLRNTRHVVEIVNLNDTRTPRGFGQMNFDHAVLITDDDSEPEPDPTSSSTNAPAPTSTTTTPVNTPSSTPTSTPTPTPTPSSTRTFVVEPTNSGSSPEINPGDSAVGLSSGAPFVAVLAAAAAFFAL